jgi:hypothetical protein
VGILLDQHPLGGGRQLLIQRGLLHVPPRLRLLLSLPP